MDWTGRSVLLGSWRKLGLATVVVAFAAIVGSVHAKLPTAVGDSVTLTELPSEALLTDKLIRAGGPFPYAKDGSAFGNRERLLPRRERGFYREYTVPTPGANNRGARRIVCGGTQPTQPETCFYTDDHYAKFRRIAQ